MTYYENRDGDKAGFEYDLINLFSKDLGLTAKFIIRPNIENALKALKAGKGDLVAAGLSQTDKREESFLFGPIYDKAEQKVICHKDNTVNNFEELQKREIIVGARTSYSERLSKLKGEYKGLSFDAKSKVSTPELLRIINENDSKYECTIADLQIFQIYRRYLPNLRLGMSLGSPEDVSWFFNQENSELQEAVDVWFKKSGKQKLKPLKERYYSFLSKYDAYDINKFQLRIKSRLPKYKKDLKLAAQQYNFDWLLLAALEP